MKLTYSDFINKCTCKDLKIQFDLIVSIPKEYHLYAYDQQIYYETFINEEDDSSDVTDFETNYQSTSNQCIVTPVEVSNGISLAEEDIEILSNAKLIKYKLYNTGWSNSCNTSSWTLFSEQSYNPEILLGSFIMNFNNNHKVKIEINNEIILEESLQDIYDMFTSEWKTYNLYFKNFRMVKSKQQYSLILKLDDTKVSNIKIYQKRRAGSGILKLHEYFISYKDN